MQGQLDMSGYSRIYFRICHGINCRILMDKPRKISYYIQIDILSYPKKISVLRDIVG